MLVILYPCVHVMHIYIDFLLLYVEEVSQEDITQSLPHYSSAMRALLRKWGAWKLQRLLWLGKRHGDSDCLLTLLPDEIIAKICFELR